MNAKYAELLKQKNEGHSWVTFIRRLNFVDLGRYATLIRMRYLCLLGPLRFYMTIYHPILNRVYYGSQYDYVRNRLDLLLRMADHAEMSNKPGVPDLERESVSFAYKVYYAIRAMFPIRHLREGRQERKIIEYSRQFMFNSSEVYKNVSDCECFEH